MEVIDIDLFRKLIREADESERMRVSYDLRNSSEDTSQRMLALPSSVTTR